MFSTESYPLPDNALLASYQKSGAFTDCYTIEIPAVVTQAQYITAFYSTAIFKLERFILKWLVAKPSSALQLELLAAGKTETFAAWSVEKRCQNQLLMCDYQKRTRSWLMVQPIDGSTGPKTRLYFGSAVVPIKNQEQSQEQKSKTEKASPTLSSQALLKFHKIYSVVLLAAAKSRLSKTISDKQN